MDDERVRAEGVLLGLACGDALGRPVEFRTAEQIARQYGRVTEMEGHGTWNKPAGTVTDDTDMALCLARSLVACEGFDPDDVGDRFVAWLASEPFDVGGMTRRSIARIREGESAEAAGRAIWEESPEGSNAGNGSVMRCAPVALAYVDDPVAAAEVSRRSSAVTHADPRCADGCAVVNLTIAGLLRGDDGVDALRDALDRVDPPAELADALRPIPTLDEDDLSNTGYVVDTVQAALQRALTADTAEAAIVDAVSSGGDADTVGAVCGAVAGARFGADALPARWLSVVDETDELRSVAGDLTKLGAERRG